MTDEYSSVAVHAVASINVEGSKFIASAFPAGERAEVEVLLKRVKEEYFDATHNCYGYALGPARRETRSSDDGEPSGTAGIKILSALEYTDLSDALIVVTRYFGGTKLGTGGLGRAYRVAAQKVLEKTGRRRRLLLQEFRLTFPYDVTSGVMRVVNEYHVRILETSYGDDVMLRLAVRAGKSDKCLKTLSELTRGNLVVKSGAQFTTTA